MAEEWQELLDMDATKAVRPPPLPKGTYRVLIQGQEQVKSEKKGTPGVRFIFTQLDPRPDVSPEKWMEYLKHPAIEGEKPQLDDTFWLSKKAVYRLREFCEKAGAKPEGTLAKMVVDSVNQTILVSIEQRVAKDGQTVFSEISGYAADKS